MMNKDNNLKIGLVIGKFAPFHLGHIDLLKFALTVVDKLYVVVYHCPDKTNIPLNQRAGWIRNTFANENVVVIDGWNAPNEHEDTPYVRNLQEKYLEKVMSGIELTHIISSEDYATHLSEYLGIENVIYDKDRVKRNISSTMIRKEFDKYKEQLPESILSYVKEDLDSIKS